MLYSLIVLEFNNLEDVIAASKAFYEYCGTKRPSRLYKYEGKYRLIVYFASAKRDIPIALEFAERIFVSFTETAKTFEHGKAMIRENALESLALL